MTTEQPKENITIEFAADALTGIARLMADYPDFIKDNEDASRQFLKFLTEGIEAAAQLKLILEGGLNRFHPQVSLAKASQEGSLRNGDQV